MDPYLLRQYICDNKYPYQKEYDLILKFINDIVPDKQYKSLIEFKKVSKKIFEDDKRTQQIMEKYTESFKDIFNIDIASDLSETLRKALDKFSYKLVGKKYDKDMIYHISIK